MLAAWQIKPTRHLSSELAQSQKRLLKIENFIQHKTHNCTIDGERMMKKFWWRLFFRRLLAVLIYFPASNFANRTGELGNTLKDSAIAVLDSTTRIGLL